MLYLIISSSVLTFILYLYKGNSEFTTIICESLKSFAPEKCTWWGPIAALKTDISLNSAGSYYQGINKNELDQLVSYCKEIGLDLIGLMCIPPINVDPEVYFSEMNELNKALGFGELSMGMSSDFLKAIKHSSTYVRIGSSIFGQRV